MGVCGDWGDVAVNKSNLRRLAASCRNVNRFAVDKEALRQRKRHCGAGEDFAVPEEALRWNIFLHRKVSSVTAS